MLFKLFINRKRKTEIDQLKNLSLGKAEDIDMNNVVRSIFQAEQIYNKLKIECHPDKFVFDENMMKIADEIFKDISANRRNYDRLKEIESLAEKELKIKI